MNDRTLDPYCSEMTGPWILTDRNLDILPEALAVRFTLGVIHDVFGKHVERCSVQNVSRAARVENLLGIVVNGQMIRVFLVLLLFHN